MSSSRDRRPRRELVLAFLAQCEDAVSTPVRHAEDLLALPRDVLARVTRDLAIEELAEVRRSGRDA